MEPGKLVCASDDGLRGLHHQRVMVLEAKLFYLVSIGVQLLGVDHGIATLSVEVAVEPSGNQLRVCHFVFDELLAGYLRQIGHDLSRGRGRHGQGCRKSENNETVAMHGCYSSSRFSRRTLTELDALGKGAWARRTGLAQGRAR